MKQKLLTIVLLLAVVFTVLLSSGLVKLPFFVETNGKGPNAVNTDSTPWFARAALENPAPSPGNEMVQQAAEKLRLVQPVYSKARFTANLFGSQMSGPGQVMLQGQGSGKSRMEFVFSLNEREQRLIQVCDNDFFYFVRQSGDERQVEYVDLRELSAARNLDANSMLSGSLTSLLERLHSLFVFEEPVAGQLGELQVWQLTGRWKPRALARLMDGLVEPNFFERQDWWRRLPTQIPHQIKVTLAKDGALPLFPYQIEYQRIDTEQANSKMQTFVSLEMFEVQLVREIPSEMFDIRRGLDRPKNRTAFYVDRLNRLQR